MKPAMKMMTMHAHVFEKGVMRDAMELVTLNLRLAVHENIEVRDTANDMLGAIMTEIANGLSEGYAAHKDIFETIIKQFSEIL